MTKETTKTVKVRVVKVEVKKIKTPTTTAIKEVVAKHQLFLGGIMPLGNPNNWTAFAFLQDGYLMIAIGCRRKRLAAAKKYWSDTHHHWGDRQEVAATVRLAEKIARLRGWPLTETAANKAAKDK